ncbi:MAG: primosomal protein N' [Flavobacteriales bacterium]|nr:primosomal protein N' [Flavobacteriales bacterium]
MRITFVAMGAFYIRVIIPLSLRGTFTYSVPDELIEEMIPGKRVVVPFGAKRYYSALIHEVNASLRQGQTTKEIEYVIDNEPIITEMQFRLWEWISEYYMCGLGTIMLSAMPGSMRLTSSSTVVLNPKSVDTDLLSEIDFDILSRLSLDESTSIQDIEKTMSKGKVQRSLDRLLKLGVVEIQESMEEEAKPKTIVFIDLNDRYNSEEALRDLMENLVRAPKQLEIVMRYLELSGYFDRSLQQVARTKLLNVSNASPAILNTLIEKGVFEKRVEMDSFDTNVEDVKASKFSEEQDRVLTEIENKWLSKMTVLLHGVTGSGKTNIYAELISRNNNSGQTLILVPEIALTAQLVKRMENLLGQKIMVYHSRFSNKERLTMWLQMLSDNEPKIILGARSAVFLPFKKLDLVIIDEEHDASYKQHESSPFYNAKDSATWLAAKFGAKVLLGSATPTVQSYYLTKTDKYALVELNVRFGEIKMPLISAVDLRSAHKDKKMQADFAPESVLKIKETIKAGKQVIIFQNRRGYAPFQLCEACGWSAECVNCDVNLTFHKYFEKLLCHYCGYSIKQPEKCPNCNSAKLKVRGYGTEKIEDDLEVLFPELRIARMDLDTTRKKKALENIIQAFSEGAYDILVGTQMITKGLDFEKVGLVLVMNADSLWNRPDFRAFERAFQLLVQVAGRAGRKNDRGSVLIQTFKPDHPIIALVKGHNYTGMFEEQLLDRRAFDYPPFSKLIKFQLSHKDAKFVKSASQFLAKELRQSFGERVLGPEEPPIARVRNRYLRQIYLKIETNLSASKSRNSIWQAIDLLEGHEDFRKVRCNIDVDPL